MATPHLENAVSSTRETIDPKFLEAMERLATYRPKPPEGSFTVEDVAEEWGVEYSTAGKKLTEMFRAGTLNRMNTENNKMFYWFKE